VRVNIDVIQRLYGTAVRTAMLLLAAINMQ
jgi:hypothetical protein